MLETTTLPQSTAAVESFSKINNNKTRLRNGLAVRTVEAMVKTSECFPANFEVTDRLAMLHSKARSSYMERCKSEERDAVEETDNLC